MVKPIDVTHQSEIDELTEDLRSALESLRFNPVDTSAYEQAQDTVPADLSIYTDESLTAMNNAKSAVDEFLAGSVDIRNQAEFDALVDAYAQAIAALEEKPADYSVLNSTMQNFTNLDGSLYSNYDDVKAVYDEVKAWADANPAVGITRQNEVDAKSDQLIEAMLTLAYKPIDTTAYEQAQETVPADLSIYTDESVTAMNNAKAAVDEFLAGDVDIRDQAELDALVSAYVQSIDDLMYKDADLTELNELLHQFSILDPSLYSNYDSVKAEVESIIQALGELMSGGPVYWPQQSVIDDLTARLRSALESLEYKPIDTSAYEQAQDTVPADLSIYDNDSVTAMNNAKAAVDEFLAGDVDIRNQAELDALVNAYVQAIAALDELTADYTALNKALADFEAIDGNLYANYNDVKDVYDSVKAWKDANPAVKVTSQADVDEQAQLLRNAIDSLVLAHFGVKEGSTAVIDGNYIYGLKTNLTAGNLRNTFLDFEGVEVTFTKAIEDARYYGTGSTVTVKYADGTEEEYTIIIFGDVDGNSIIDSDDAYATLAAAADNSLFDAVQRKAANVDGVRRISVDDYAIINDAVLGINEIDQTAAA